MKPNFQLIIIIVFIVAAIAGVLVFSGVIPIGNDKKAGGLGTVNVWGTVPANLLTAPLEEFNKANPSFVVKYEQKAPADFDRELLEALATRKGPDLFFLPDDLAYQYADKIFTIPYKSYPLANFKTSFAGAGEVFLTSRGIMAFPMTVDPLVMYYNRSILDTNGVVYPPAYWEDLSGMVPTLTKKDTQGKITQSAIAMGQASNVAHFKEILSTLFMQAGNPIIVEQGGKFISMLDSSTGSYDLPSMLKFYTDFADPLHPAYSWNKSFPLSTDAFSAENSAFYLGFASELESLANRNPNQNFFITSVPQIKDSKFKLTGARVTGLAISSASKNLNTAFTAASLLATSDFARKFANALNVAPARRDLLANAPGDAYSPIIYSSAVYARAWLDPSPEDTDSIWAQMINSVLSNAMRPGDAIKDAGSKLRLLLLK